MLRNPLRFGARTALAAFVLFAAACSTQPRIPLEERREIFQDAWKMISEKHFDPKLGGVDWKKVHDDYAPRVDGASTRPELAVVLNEMVGELHHSHVGVFPPRDQSAAAKSTSTESKPAGDAKAPSKDSGTIGLRIVELEGKIVVLAVDAGGPAAAAGVRPGDEVVAVDDLKMSKMLATIREDSPGHTRGMAPYAASRYLDGAPGTKVTLSTRTGAGDARRIELERVPSEMASMDLGNMGSMTPQFESRRLEGGVLYIRFTPCFGPLQERLEKALAANHDASGVILDVRDNPGGLGALAMSVARLFCDKQTSLGTMQMRDQEPLKFVVLPSRDPYRGPVVILVNGSTASTSEILAAGMQKIGRARVVGETSMGACLPSVIEEISHGWRVQAVVGNLTLPDGTSVEGPGVVPDVPVALTQRELAASGDPVIAVAMKELANAPRLAAAAAPEAAAAPAPKVDHPPCQASAEAAEIMDKIAAASLGKRKAGEVKSMKIVGKMRVMNIEGTVETIIAAPNRMWAHVTIPNMSDTYRGFDGERGWSKDPVGGLRELTGAELGSMRRELRLDASDWRSHFARVEITGRKKISNRDMIILEQTPYSDEGSAPIVVRVDAATYLPMRIDSTSETPMGNMKIRSNIVEYSEFDGLLMPKLTKVESGQVSAEMTTESVTVGVPVDEAIFKMPAESAPAGGK